MPQSTTKLPRMQNQAQRRAEPEDVADRLAEVAAPVQEVLEKPRRKSGVMRQFELIDRVRHYNPNSNEALLDRAYVYAMKAHGSQIRASGDPYFSLSLIHI